MGRPRQKIASGMRTLTLRTQCFDKIRYYRTTTFKHCIGFSDALTCLANQP